MPDLGVYVRVHGAGGQVGVFMLQLAIQGQASLFPVDAQHGGQSVDLAGGGAGRNLVTEVGVKVRDRGVKCEEKIGKLKSDPLVLSVATH